MSSIAGSHRNLSTRNVRKIEAPRPLKDSSLNESNPKTSYSPLALSSYTIDCVEKLMGLMDMVVNSIEQYSESNAIESSILSANIIHLCKHLKIYGPQLENSIYQSQLDRAFLTFREGLIRGLLEYEARAHLLDIVELRECNWISRKNLSPVTVNNISALAGSPSYQDLGDYADFSYIPPIDSPSSKHREKSSKSNSKGYCRGEVIIRNSDSGKVMGIKGRRVHMIEQLSETIISFQRVPPTAKERVVQITGPNEDKISYAARLIENTIRNNSSPVKEFCESESSCSSEDSLGCEDLSSYQKMRTADQSYLYRHKVFVRNCQLTITGDDYTYVTVAKAILDDYFSKLRKSDSFDNAFDWYVGRRLLNLGDALTQPFGISQFSDNVLLDENNEESRKITSHRLNEVSVRNDLKSHTSDFSEVSNVNPLPDSFSYRDCTINQKPDSLLLSKTDDNSSYVEISSFQSISDNSSSRTTYTREFLLLCKKSELSRRKPDDWALITLRFPQLIKDPEHSSDDYPTKKEIC